MYFVSLKVKDRGEWLYLTCSLFHLLLCTCMDTQQYCRHVLCHVGLTRNIDMIANLQEMQDMLSSVSLQFFVSSYCNLPQSVFFSWLIWVSCYTSVIIRYETLWSKLNEFWQYSLLEYTVRALGCDFAPVLIILCSAWYCCCWWWLIWN
jgi:hypothetical protein